MPSLDVGCGARGNSDVNVDVKRQAINLTVQADGQHLPFKNNCFENVVCLHTIEHVDNPYLLLNELIRVLKGHLLIVCPYKLSRMAKAKEHKHYFDGAWFWEQLQKYPVGFEVQFVLSSTRNIFSLPLEVRVDVWRLKKR